MKNLSLLWQTLETPPGLTRSAADWNRLLSADFALVKKLLNLKRGLAGAVPCPGIPPCGCDHSVVEHDRDDIIAVCCCEPQRCRTVSIKREHALIYELNFSTLGGSIAQALSCAAEDKVVDGLVATRLIGIYSPRAGIGIPIYLTIQHDSADFQHVVEKLIATNHVPFILMSPTDNLTKLETTKLLREHNARFLALERILIWDGKFTAPETLNNLLPDFFEQVAPAKELYALHKEGKTWRAVFEGETKNILHSKGMDYIATLLANPHKSISCVDLYGSSKVQPSKVDGEIIDDDYSLIPAVGEALNVDAVSDRKGLTNCRKRLAEIDDAIEIADDTGNNAKRAQLENERTKFEKEVSRTQGMHGKLRVRDNPEKARQAVTRAVDRAIKGMEKQHPNLWAHIKTTITTGNALSYTPDRAIRWDIRH